MYLSFRHLGLIKYTYPAVHVSWSPRHSQLLRWNQFRCWDPLRYNLGIICGPVKYQDPILWAWLEFFHSFKKCQFKSQLISEYLMSYLFLVNTLQGTAKVPAVDSLRLNTLRGTKTSFKTPTITLVHFIWESPFPGIPTATNQNHYSGD